MKDSAEHRSTRDPHVGDATPDRTWTIRRLTADDVDDVLDLARISFPDEGPDRFTSASWKWEFGEGAYAPSVIVVADDHRSLVGHYAANPFRVSVDGSDRIAAIAVDVMTHPDYRRQGMFVALGREAMAAAAAEGIDFCVGYPVRREVMPGHLAVGWVHAFDIPVYVYPLRLTGALAKILPRWFPTRLVAPALGAAFHGLVRPALATRRLLRPAQGPLDIVDVDEFDSRFDELWAQGRRSHRLMAHRDAAFLRWRYTEHPRARYRIVTACADGRLVGYVVTRRCKLLGIPTCAVVDLLVSPDRADAIYPLIRCVVDRSRRDDVDVVALMLNRASPWASHVRQAGFLRASQSFHFILYQTRPTLLRELLLDARSWWLTWGDVDVL